MGARREIQTSLDGLRDKNLMHLKKLNMALFPFRHNDKYYADALASGEFTKLAYYSDICVGAIACRLEKKEGGVVRVYIMTLGVLAPYRGLGIGKKVLNHALELCAKQNISEIYVHVQTNNEDAISFYKKFGFEIMETIQNYYTNITPPDCYVLTKYITQTQPKKTTASGLVDQLSGWKSPYPSSMHEVIKGARHYTAMHSWSISHAPHGLVLGPMKHLGHLDLGKRKTQPKK